MCVFTLVCVYVCVIVYMTACACGQPSLSSPDTHPLPSFSFLSFLCPDLSLASGVHHLGEAGWLVSLVCLCLPGAQITSVHHHIWIFDMSFKDQAQVLILASQAPYCSNCFPSPNVFFFFLLKAHMYPRLLLHTQLLKLNVDRNMWKGISFIFYFVPRCSFQ